MTLIKFNKEKKKFRWTNHIKEKIKEYQLSEKRLIKIFRNPERIEEGIVPGTFAVMQRAGTKKHPYEIWLMYQIKSSEIVMISAWKYPGKTSPKEAPPIPTDILETLEKISKKN